ncbi:MAG: extracellular solute-binding protein [Clostridiaceae bacterium]|nr:extracellular solute-binding protein [Clostridiaceae bacterium]
MKNKSKRVLVLLVAVIMLLGLVACQQGGTQPSKEETQKPTPTPTAKSAATEPAKTDPPDPMAEWKLYDKPTTWVAMRTTFANAPSSGDQLAHKEMEKITNVYLDIQEAGRGAEYNKALNLAFATDSQPEIIAVSASAAQKYAADTGKIIDLTELLKEHGKNYLARVKQHNLEKRATASDGKYWNISKIRIEHDNRVGMINKPLLDELNLKVPTTVEEMTEVLRKVKAHNPEAIPWIAGAYSGSGGVYAFAEYCFNISKGPQEFNNAIRYSYYEDQDATKDMVKWLRTLYKEGLLDASYLSRSNDDANAAIRQGQVAFVFGWFSGGTDKVDADGKTIPDSTEWVTVPGMMAPDGKRHLSPNNPVHIGIAVTSKAADPEKVVKYFDYYFTDAGTELFNYGVKGVTFNEVDGKKVYTDLIAKATSPMNAARAQGVLVEEWPMYQPEAMPGLYGNKLGESIKESIKYWDPLPPVLSASPDKMQEMSAIRADLDKTWQAYFADMITGDKEVDDLWPEYVSRVKEAKVERYIELIREMYQNWLNKK